MLQMLHLTANIKFHWNVECFFVWTNKLYSLSLFYICLLYGTWWLYLVFFIVTGTSLTVIIKLFFFLNSFIFTKFKRNCFFFLSFFFISSDLTETFTLWKCWQASSPERTMLYFVFFFLRKCLWRVRFQGCKINCSDVTEQT